ncbi:MAG: hypothetical protein WA021_00280 [Minisyncoccia bacterium]
MLYNASRAKVHATFISGLYFFGMTAAALTLLMWFSFHVATTDGFLALIAPTVIRAQYADATAAATVSSPFGFSFNSPGTLYETGSESESSSPYFWLNSGGKLLIQNGIGKTVQGSLTTLDPWRVMYSSMNPLDTGSGYNPQNTLRLVTRSDWQNVEETLQFNIKKTNLTNTPNRDGYSGIFLMGRYGNSDNLYYAGIRHDGAAVIKKKINGTYYTLVQKQVFGAEGDYNKTTNPNLIPNNKWMGLRARFTNQSDGSVKIQLLLDKNNSGTWTTVLTATDKSTGGTPLKNAGALGIRTDFMDVEFDNFRAEKI